MFDQFDKRTRLILLAATMAALCLATIRLGHDPLWIDEAIVWYWGHNTIRGIVNGVQASEPHGAFYYVIIKIWLRLGGDSEFWLRAFSALCFTFTVPVVYVIGQTVSGRRAGLYAACLAATAPFLIHYAMEVRMYAMLVLFCSLALMSVALIISRQSDHRPAVIGQGLRGLWRRWRRGASVSIAWGDDLLWAIYIVAVSGGMYSHNTAVLLPVVTTLIFLVAIAAAPPFRWLRLRNLIIANIAALALYAFNIPLLLINFENNMPPSPSPVSFGQMQKTFFTVYGNEYLPGQAIALAALCVLALWGWRRRKDWQWVGFTLIGALGLPLALLIVSNFYPQVFAARTIIWTSIPFYVACGAGIARLPGAGLRRIVLAGLLLSSLYGVLQVYERGIREPWDQLAQTLAQEASSDSAVLLCPFWVRTPFGYYWRRHDNDMAIFGEQDYQMASLFLEPVDGEVRKWKWRGEPRTMASLFDDYSELWIASRRGDSSTYAYCGLPALQDRFSGRGQLVAERSFGEGVLKLLTFARDDGSAASD